MTLILMNRNDRRNYYKLSIGLGAMVETTSASAKYGGKSGADDVLKTGVAAGGIDQYVCFGWL